MLGTEAWSQGLTFDRSYCAGDTAEGQDKSIPVPGAEEPQTCSPIYTLQYSTSGQQQTQVCHTSESTASALLVWTCGGYASKLWPGQAQTYKASVLHFWCFPILFGLVFCEFSTLLCVGIHSKATVPHFCPVPVFQDQVF